MGVVSWIRAIRQRDSNGNQGGSEPEFRRGSSLSNDDIRTPEEQGLTVLSRNDGRMKQSEIAEILNCSESTVSRKLSKMESAGTITRYRIGREKIVFLPEDVPASFDTPLGRR